MKTIAITGGGFSSVMTAWHLLDRSSDLRVIIINSHYPLALGPAYSAQDPALILNISAGNMSAFPAQPDHFIDWLLKENILADKELARRSFVPRSHYGAYLRELIRPLLLNPRFSEKNSRTVDIQQYENTYRILLSDDSEIEADAVVLAPGNFLPAQPRISNTAFFSSRDYFQDPWNPAFLKDLEKEKDILLIGSGLTMIDCLLQLQDKGHKGKVYAVSPKGYTPASHISSPPYPDFHAELKGKSLLEVFRIVIRHCRIAPGAGSSWQSVIDSVKPHVQEIWKGFSAADKKQFISHVRHIWGVARHRLPQESYAKLGQMIRSGQLEILAGRITALKEDNEGIDSELLLRKTREARTLRVARVINCTGPQINYEEISDPLIRNLREKKLICPNELKMGIRALPGGQVLDPENQPVRHIYAIGSVLRGVLWETTAVPELRRQAADVAAQLTKALQAGLPNIL